MPSGQRRRRWPGYPASVNGRPSAVMKATPVAVTPAGIRAGDRATSEALCARRGSAVLAYCERVAGPGSAVTAAAESFARFRGAVIATPDSEGIDPEVLLLSATRHAAARHAPRPPLAGVAARLGAGRRGPQTCALVPELLAARAEGALSDADRLRLSRHLQRCRTCATVQERFGAAEAAYRSPPDAAPDARASAMIVAALTKRAGAGPAPAAPGESEDPGRRLAAVLATPIAADPTREPDAITPDDAARDARPQEPDAPTADRQERDTTDPDRHDADTPTADRREPDAEDDLPAQAPSRLRDAEPPTADPGPAWPDDSRIVTAARIARQRAAPLAAAASPTSGPAAAERADASTVGPRATVPVADSVGGELAVLQSTLDPPVAALPSADAPADADVADDLDLDFDFDDDDDWGEARHGPGLLPLPPPRRVGRRRDARLLTARPSSGIDDEPPADDPSSRSGAFGAVHPLSTSVRRRPLWVLLLPVLVVLVAIGAALSIAGVLAHSPAHAIVRGAPAAPVAAPAPAASTARHRARHHRHHTAGAGAAAAAAFTLPSTNGSPGAPSAGAPSAGRVSSGSSAGGGSSDSSAGGGSSGSSVAPTAASPDSSGPAATPEPASQPSTPAPVRQTPAASAPPATSIQSGGSSSAAPPTGGGAPSTGGPSTYQPSGG